MSLLLKVSLTVVLVTVSVWIQRGLRRDRIGPSDQNHQSFYYRLYAVSSAIGSLIALWLIWSR